MLPGRARSVLPLAVVTAVVGLAPWLLEQERGRERSRSNVSEGLA